MKLSYVSEGAAADVELAGDGALSPPAPALSCHRREDGGLAVTVSGDWLLSAPLPATGAVLAHLGEAPKPKTISFDASYLGRWDTGLVAMLVAVRHHAEAAGVRVDQDGLPESVKRLLALAFAVRAPEGARRVRARSGMIERIGEATLSVACAGIDLLTFTGEVTLSLGRMLTGRATYLRSHLLQYVQEAGAEALPIAGLITFLIGMIFAFVGVMQLAPFGVGIYTADLVAIAMVREMSPIMTAILMAGRTGASYAAEIGTMKVNEEVDALTTLGLNPVDFLVTPRVLALTLMLPLLSLYGSLMGILGGMLVGLMMLDVNVTQYSQQTVEAVELRHLWGGLLKSLVFGSLVAMAGCQQGMACGGSALAVGQATTRAVVAGIVLIVVSASLLTVIYINLGI